MYNVHVRQQDAPLILLAGIFVPWGGEAGKTAGKSGITRRLPLKPP